MAYTMHLVDQESGDGYDVSSLVHNITHSTTLEGQAGKLTFTVQKDPNNLLKMSMGSIVRFWNNEYPVFYGFIFTIRVDNKGNYTVTAYDQMRYLQSHDYYLAEDKTVVDIFEYICTTLKLKYKVLGKAKLKQDPKLEKQVFADKSYFDILQYAINETNVYSVKVDFEEKSKQLAIGTTVNYTGGANYISPASAIPASTNRTAGQGVITNFSKGSLHPYHIVGTTSNVNGWVDDTSITIASSASSLVNQSFYFIRDNFGTLELNDIENNVKHSKTGIVANLPKNWTGDESYKYDESSSDILEPLIIGDESLLTDYEYELDIDKDTYNQLFLVETVNGAKNDDANKKVTLADQNSEAIKKWGLLRKIVNIKGTHSKAELQEYLKLSLEQGSQVSKTLRLNALGYNGVDAGDGFLLRIGKLGIEQMMYVTSATHTYEGDKHLMKLEISTSRGLTEVV